MVGNGPFGCAFDGWPRRCVAVDESERGACRAAMLMRVAVPVQMRGGCVMGARAAPRPAVDVHEGRHRRQPQHGNGGDHRHHSAHRRHSTHSPRRPYFPGAASPPFESDR